MTIIIFFFRNPNDLFAVNVTYHLLLFVFLDYCVPANYP
jgi:hypothetical protein